MTVGNPTTGEHVLHYDATTITRVDVMQAGARILMFVALGVGLLLTILIAAGQPAESQSLLNGALHCLNFGATMAVAVGALHGHRAILGSVGRTQRQMARYDTQIEDRLKRLERLDRKIADQLGRLERLESGILSAATDDLAARRHGG